MSLWLEAALSSSLSLHDRAEVSQEPAWRNAGGVNMVNAVILDMVLEGKWTCTLLLSLVFLGCLYSVHLSGKHPTTHHRTIQTTGTLLVSAMWGLYSPDWSPTVVLGWGRWRSFLFAATWAVTTWQTRGESHKKIEIRCIRSRKNTVWCCPEGLSKWSNIRPLNKQIDRLSPSPSGSKCDGSVSSKHLQGDKSGSCDSETSVVLSKHAGPLSGYLPQPQHVVTAVLLPRQDLTDGDPPSHREKGNMTLVLFLIPQWPKPWTPRHLWHLKEEPYTHTPLPP